MVATTLLPQYSAVWLCVFMASHACLCVLLPLPAAKLAEPVLVVIVSYVAGAVRPGVCCAGQSLLVGISTDWTLSGKVSVVFCTDTGLTL